MRSSSIWSRHDQKALIRHNYELAKHQGEVPKLAAMPRNVNGLQRYWPLPHGESCQISLNRQEPSELSK